MMFLLNGLIEIASYILGTVFYPLFVAIPLAILDFSWDLLLNFMSYFTFTNIVFRGGDNIVKVDGTSNFLNNIGLTGLNNWQDQPIVVIWFSMIVSGLILGIIFSFIVILKRTALGGEEGYKSLGSDLSLVTKRLFIGTILILIFPLGVQFILGLINWIFFQMTSASRGVDSDQLQNASLANLLVQRLSLIKQAGLEKDLIALSQTIPTQTVTSAEGTQTLAGDFSALKSHFGGNGTGILDYVKNWDKNITTLSSKLNQLSSSNKGDINIGLSIEIKNLLLQLDSFLVKLQQLTKGVSNLDKYNVLNEVVEKPELIKNLTDILTTLNQQSQSISNATLFSLFREYKTLILDNENIPNTLTYPTFKINDAKALLSGTSGNTIQSHFQIGTNPNPTTLPEIVNLLNTNAFKANVAGLTNNQVSVIEQMIKYGTLNPTSTTISLKSLIGVANEMTVENLKNPILVFRLGEFRRIWATTFFGNNNNSVFENLNLFTSAGNKKVDVGNAGQVTLGLSELLKGETSQFSREGLLATTINNLKFTNGYLNTSVLNREDTDIISTVKSLGAKHPISLADVGFQIALNDFDAKYLGSSPFQAVKIENAVFSLLITGSLIYALIVFFMYLIKRMVSLILLFILSPFALFTNLHEPIVSDTNSGVQLRQNWRGYIWVKAYITESASILMAALSLQLFATLLEPITKTASSIVDNVSPVDPTSSFFGGGSSLSIVKTLFSGLITLTVLLSIEKVQGWASQFISGWIFSTDKGWFDEGSKLTKAVVSNIGKGVSVAKGAGGLAKQGLGMATQMVGGTLASRGLKKAGQVKAFNNANKGNPNVKARKLSRFYSGVTKSRFGSRALQKGNFEDDYRNAKGAINKAKVKADAKKQGFVVGELGMSKMSNSLRNIYATGNVSGGNKNRAKKTAKHFDKYTANSLEKLGLGSASSKVDKFQNWRKEVNQGKAARQALDDRFENIRSDTGTGITDKDSLAGYFANADERDKNYISDTSSDQSRRDRIREARVRRDEEIKIVSDINQAAPQMVRSGPEALKAASLHAEQTVDLSNNITPVDEIRTVINQVSNLSDHQINHMGTEVEQQAMYAIKSGNFQPEQIQMIKSNMRNSYGEEGYKAKVMTNKIKDAVSNLHPQKQEETLTNALTASTLSAKELYNSYSAITKNNPDYKFNQKEFREKKPSEYSHLKNLEQQIMTETNIAQNLSAGLGVGSTAVDNMVNEFSDFENKIKKPKKNTVYKDLFDSKNKKLSNKRMIDNINESVSKSKAQYERYGVSEGNFIDTSFEYANASNSSVISPTKRDKHGNVIKRASPGNAARGKRFEKDVFVEQREDKVRTREAIARSGRGGTKAKRKKEDDTDSPNEPYNNTGNDDNKS